MSTDLKHIIEAQQFNREWLENELFPLAENMQEVVRLRGSKLFLKKE